MSSDILQTLAEHARARVERAKQQRSLSSVRILAEQLPRRPFRFARAIEARVDEAEEIAFICECKKASPSKGLIAPDFPYLDIAREYESAGADCISVLTEPDFFLGSDEYLREIAATVYTPCLRKDFTVDPYMIYEAKLLGAAAVLLICAILSPAELREYLSIADSLGLSALVEAHDEAEIETALNAGARIIGVNNRNLRDFSVDPSHAANLRKNVPAGTLFVVESGMQTAADIANARAAGADAVLVGETLMRAPDKRAKLRELKGKSR